MTAEQVLDARTEEAIVGGEDVELPRGTEAWRALAGAFGQGRVVARTAAQLTGELAKIVVGRSAVAPAKGDRRFADPAWNANPIYRRIEQTYLASAGALGEIVVEWGRSVEDPARVQRASFAAGIVTSAAAPTNFLVTNPAALKQVFDTGGMSLVRGVGNSLDDVRHNGGHAVAGRRGPRSRVGSDLALTPGAVVYRDEVAELMQYAPTTADRARAAGADGAAADRPVLLPGPAAGPQLRRVRGVAAGCRCSCVSWRNPHEEQADWNLDTYAARVSPAIDVVREITGSDDVNVFGLLRRRHHHHHPAQPSGRAGRRRACTACRYAVTLLDFGGRRTLGAFSAPRLSSSPQARSKRKGLIMRRATWAPCSPGCVRTTWSSTTGSTTT